MDTKGKARVYDFIFAYNKVYNQFKTMLLAYLETDEFHVATIILHMTVDASALNIFT